MGLLGLQGLQGLVGLVGLLGLLGLLGLGGASVMGSATVAETNTGGPRTERQCTA